MSFPKKLPPTLKFSKNYHELLFSPKKTQMGWIANNSIDAKKARSLQREDSPPRSNLVKWPAITTKFSKHKDKVWSKNFSYIMTISFRMDQRGWDHTADEIIGREDLFFFLLLPFFLFFCLLWEKYDRWILFIFMLPFLK